MWRTVCRTWFARVAVIPLCALMVRAVIAEAVSGTFEQKRVLHDVGVTLKSSGTWTFEPDRLFVWNTLKPAPSVFAATPTNYSFTVAGKTTSHRLKTQIRDLAQLFEIKEMREFVEKVEPSRENPVFEADGVTLPSSLKVVFRNGDRLEITLSR